MKKLSYFSSQWCFPCKATKPLIAKFEDKFEVTYYDVEEQMELVKEKGVKSVPTVIIEDEDGECARLVGSSQIITPTLEKHI